MMKKNQALTFLQHVYESFFLLISYILIQIVENQGIILVYRIRRIKVICLRMNKMVKS